MSMREASRQHALFLINLAQWSADYGFTYSPECRAAAAVYHSFPMTITCTSTSNSRSYRLAIAHGGMDEEQKKAAHDGLKKCGLVFHESNQLVLMLPTDRYQKGEKLFETVGIAAEVLMEIGVRPGCEKCGASSPALYCVQGRVAALCGSCASAYRAEIKEKKWEERKKKERLPLGLLGGLLGGLIGAVIWVLLCHSGGIASLFGGFLLGLLGLLGYGWLCGKKSGKGMALTCVILALLTPLAAYSAAVFALSRAVTELAMPYFQFFQAIFVELFPTLREAGELGLIGSEVVLGLVGAAVGSATVISSYRRRRKMGGRFKPLPPPAPMPTPKQRAARQAARQAAQPKPVNVLDPGDGDSSGNKWKV